MNIISGYITTTEFENSAYYCAFAECCSGNVGILGDLILIASDMIANYVGYDFHQKEYEDNFLGTGVNVRHLRMMPLSGIVSIEYRNKREMYGDRGYSTMYYQGTSTNPITGSISDYYVCNPSTSQIEVPNGFYKNYRYRVRYIAGYTTETMPELVKTATKMMVAQLATQIDTGNLVNQNVNYENVKLDKTGFTFGNSRVIQNYVFKDSADMGFLPYMIQNMLRRYKYSKNMS